MAAPKVTKVANLIMFEGDQSFTFVLTGLGVKKAKFFGIDWYLDPDYKYPCNLLDTMIFPNFNGYPCIFYAKASGTGPLTGSIMLLETSPHRNDSYIEEFKVPTMVIAL